MRLKSLKFCTHVEYLLSIKKGLQFLKPNLTDVGNTGFEPVTSCLSSKRSKPTELIAHKRKKPPVEV